jgi:hypothetical protein
MDNIQNYDNYTRIVTEPLSYVLFYTPWAESSSERTDWATAACRRN